MFKDFMECYAGVCGDVWLHYHIFETVGINDECVSVMDDLSSVMASHIRDARKTGVNHFNFRHDCTISGKPVTVNMDVDLADGIGYSTGNATTSYNTTKGRLIINVDAKWGVCSEFDYDIEGLILHELHHARQLANDPTTIMSNLMKSGYGKRNNPPLSDDKKYIKIDKLVKDVVYRTNSIEVGSYFASIYMDLVKYSKHEGLDDSDCVNGFLKDNGFWKIYEEMEREIRSLAETDEYDNALVAVWGNVGTYKTKSPNKIKKILLSKVERAMKSIASRVGKKWYEMLTNRYSIRCTTIH